MWIVTLNRARVTIPLKNLLGKDFHASHIDEWLRFHVENINTLQ